MGHVYAEVAARHGWRDISPVTLTARFKAAWRECTDFDYTRAGWERLVNRTFRGLIAGRERVDFFPELYERFAEPDAWRVFDDVQSALDTLAALGTRLGVISNWDERLRPLLQHLHLHDRFETVTVSCEVGSPKPSATIFTRAAEELGLSPGSILHVGDSVEMDVAGARAAGFQALHLERDLKRIGDNQIHLLTQLSPLVAGPIRPR